MISIIVKIRRTAIFFMTKHKLGSAYVRAVGLRAKVRSSHLVDALSADPFPRDPCAQLSASPMGAHDVCCLTGCVHSHDGHLEHAHKGTAAISSAFSRGVRCKWSSNVQRSRQANSSFQALARDQDPSHAHAHLTMFFARAGGHGDKSIAHSGCDTE